MTAALPDRYQLVRRIRSTSISQSYEARGNDGRPGQFLVEVMTGVPREAPARAALERDLRIISSLRHPHLLQVVEVSALPDGTPMVVSELPGGDTLASWLEAGGALPPEAAISFLAALANALATIHALGVSHGAVTPEAVFLMPGAGGAIGLPRLGGFGTRWLAAGSPSGAADADGAEMVGGEESSADVAGLAVIAGRLLPGWLVDRAEWSASPVAFVAAVADAVYRERSGYQLALDDLEIAPPRRRRAIRIALGTAVTAAVAVVALIGRETAGRELSVRPSIVAGTATHAGRTLHARLRPAPAPLRGVTADQTSPQVQAPRPAAAKEILAPDRQPPVRPRARSTAALRGVVWSPRSERLMLVDEAVAPPAGLAGLEEGPR